MKKVLFVLSIFFLFSLPTFAGVTVKASGVGPTKREAIHAAQRSAVEQGVGTFVSSETMTKNYMMVSDKILSKSRGYVKSYKVISAKKRVDGNWDVVISAEVDKGKLKDDLNALGILREKMGNPRILVIYYPETEDALESNDPAVTESYEGIVEYLTEKEFPVVDKKIADQFTLRKFSSSDEVYQTAVKLGLSNQAEYIVVYNLKAQKQKSTNIFKRVRVMISAKVLNVSTGQIYANQSKKVLGIDKDSIQFAYRKAARKAGKLVGKFLVKKLVKRWQSDTVSGRPVVLELRNIKDFSMLLEFKENIKKAYGVKNLIQRNSTGTSVDYELSYVGDISTLKDNIYKIFDSMGIKIAPPVSTGDRITVDFSPKADDNGNSESDKESGEKQSEDDDF